ncbi:MAG: hypothetical protein WCO11_07305 [Sphingomonadales bacterium]
MKRALLLLLPLAACAPDLPPEQVAAVKAEARVRAVGHTGATLLAPIAGLDDRGRIGVCGLIETPAGPVRVVVTLADGAVRTGVPASQGANRLDLGESRYCSDTARARWEQLNKVDPVGLAARIADQAE